LFYVRFTYESMKNVQRDVKPLLDGDRVAAMGEAIEKPTSDRTLYRTWATGIVRDELHKAGWRLADLLQKIL
jgi:hypothetical protein